MAGGREPGAADLPWAALLLSALAGAATALLASHAASGRHQRKPRRRVLGVIPARYESQRFPGKPLVDILGKPMVVRTWEQACRATSLDRVVVATDDDRIADACRHAGADVIMTSADCPNGTERCAQAAEELGEAYDLVVNIQGDEPLIDPAIINACVHALQASPDAVYSTACTPLALADAGLTQRVKVALDSAGYALYFSRGLLPANKSGRPAPHPPPFADRPYLLHLGLACFDAAFLRLYCRLPPTPLMLAEDLEQLKVLEHGHRIKVVQVEHCAHGVDEPGDVDSIVAKMRELGLT